MHFFNLNLITGGSFLRKILMSFLALGLFIPLDAQNFVARLSGSQEKIPVTTPATGAINASYDAGTSTLTVSGSFEGLTGDLAVGIAGGAHIHTGYAGQNGPVTFILNSELSADNRSGTFEADSNTFVLNAAEEEALLGRQFYINIHSATFGGGELRGQLLPASADAYFQANLLGSQEAPAVMTGGVGTVLFELNGNTLTASGSFSDLEGSVNTNIAGGIHLHVGLPGENGPVELLVNSELAMNGTEGIFLPDSNTFTLTASQRSILEARGMYVNLHSTVYGSGELRGQVLGQADAYFQANLSAPQAMPSAFSPGQGTVMLEVDDMNLRAVGQFAGLSSELDTSIVGGVHIHEGLAGQSGGVVKVIATDAANDLLSGQFQVADNGFMLSESEREQLFARGYYINLHSLKYGSGELRGQVQGLSQAYFHGILNGMFEAPPVNTNGSGAVAAELNGDQLFVTGTFANLGSDFNPAVAMGAHIHTAAPGRNGSIVDTLVPDLGMDNRSGTFFVSENRFTLSPNGMDNLMNQEYYVNIHSTDIPSGELRAPLLPVSQAVFVANLSGDGHAPAVRTAAIGQAIATWNGNTLKVSGGFNELSSPVDETILGGAHIHWNIAGSNGPVRQILNLDLLIGNQGGTFAADSNTFELSTAGADSLVQRMAYINIHTTNFGGGEIRGQLLPLAERYFTATLDAANTLPRVESSASGQVVFEKRGSFLTGSGSFSGLTDELDEGIAGGVHLHQNVAGFNGPVAFLVNSELENDKLSGVFLADSNRWELDNAEETDLLNEAYYVNLHSLAFGSGELRGQVLTDINFEPEGDLAINAPMSNGMVTLQGAAATLADIDWDDATEPNGNPLAYRWQLATDAGFSNIVADIATEDQSMLQLTFGTIDTLLSNLGVMPGGSAKVYHRAIATDGSLPVFGEADSVTFTRGALTNVDEALELGSFQVRPVPGGQQVVASIEVATPGEARVSIVDLQGKMLANKVWNLRQGMNEITLDTRNFAAGLYMISYQRDDLIISKKWAVK